LAVALAPLRLWFIHDVHGRKARFNNSFCFSEAFRLLSAFRLFSDDLLLPADEIFPMRESGIFHT
jgi:hypothetical protein